MLFDFVCVCAIHTYIGSGDLWTIFFLQGGALHILCGWHANNAMTWANESSGDKFKQSTKRPCVNPNTPVFSPSSDLCCYPNHIRCRCRWWCFDACGAYCVCGCWSLFDSVFLGVCISVVLFLLFSTIFYFIFQTMFKFIEFIYCQCQLLVVNRPSACVCAEYVRNLCKMILGQNNKY